MKWLDFQAAGGMSNLLDRIFRHGLVTDFVTIHMGLFHTGVFNPAQIAQQAGASQPRHDSIPRQETP